MATPETLGSIGQIAFTISDLDRAIAFYKDGLGLPLLFQAPPGLAFFDCNGIRLMLSVPEGEYKPGPSATIYFKVGAIDATVREMKTRKVAFVDEPHLIARMPDHELWMCFLRDPDGNSLALMEERKSG
jgi:methylmalonyl-CoA/ethylmalonyl-CoA epimerase